MIVMKVLVYGIFILMISVDASLCGLNDSQKDDLYSSLISFVRKLGEKETVVISGHFNGPVRSIAKNYETQQGDYGDEVRNKEGERILEFCGAMNMAIYRAIEIKIFKKRTTGPFRRGVLLPTHSVTHVKKHSEV